jgi:hypothetical protein
VSPNAGRRAHRPRAAGLECRITHSHRGACPPWRLIRCCCLLPSRRLLESRNPRWRTRPQRTFFAGQRAVEPVRPYTPNRQTACSVATASVHRVEAIEAADGNLSLEAGTRRDPFWARESGRRRPGAALPMAPAGSTPGVDRK